MTGEGALPSGGLGCRGPSISSPRSVDDKSSQYSFANEARRIAGAQTVAQFANEQGA